MVFLWRPVCSYNSGLNTLYQNTDTYFKLLNWELFFKSSLGEVHLDIPYECNTAQARYFGASTIILQRKSPIIPRNRVLSLFWEFLMEVFTYLDDLSMKYPLKSFSWLPILHTLSWWNKEILYLPVCLLLTLAGLIKDTSSYKPSLVYQDSKHDKFHS